MSTANINHNTNPTNTTTPTPYNRANSKLFQYNTNLFSTFKVAQECFSGAACSEELISQGAEGRIYLINFSLAASPLTSAIVKQRFNKAYRHIDLDKKLTQQRTVSEVKSIIKAAESGIDTPILYYCDYVNNKIFMEQIKGETVKCILHQLHWLDNDVDRELAMCITSLIGSTIARLHQSKLIHGDLTSSNMMIRGFHKHNSPSSLTLIDFGLSYQCELLEDRAVDLYVLERAFHSTHPGSMQLFQLVLSAYTKQFSSQGAAVLAKLEAVRLRGRKKQMIG
jgi:TP53 regulating kinase-like protein